MKKINIIDLGDLTCKSYGNFMILNLNDCLRFIKREYYQYDLVKFEYQEEHYILEIKYKLTNQKIINI